MNSNIGNMQDSSEEASKPKSRLLKNSPKKTIEPKIYGGGRADKNIFVLMEHVLYNQDKIARSMDYDVSYDEKLGLLRSCTINTIKESLTDSAVDDDKSIIDLFEENMYLKHFEITPKLPLIYESTRILFRLFKKNSKRRITRDEAEAVVLEALDVL